MSNLKTVLGVAIVILCVIALYYLVVVLARSVAREDELGRVPVPTYSLPAAELRACT